MFDHVTIRVSDHDASERFYSTVLATLGVEPRHSHSDHHYVLWENFTLTGADDENPVTRRLHVGIRAASRELVDEFWRVGTDAGYTDDGAPGWRPQYSEDYYGAFLLDPDGNSFEAVHLDSPVPPGRIDHLWIRVADVAASKRFYETVAPYGGFRLETDTPERAQFVGGGSFSVLSGTPTERVHLAFGVGDEATVDAFHSAALEAGYRDHGAPGERPVYHPGYYGAFVLDPDGNNVELVKQGLSATRS